MSVITKVGIMPFTTSQLYGADLTRRVCFIKNPTQIKPIGNTRILLNINNFPNDPYSKDLIWYKEQLLKVPVTSLKPKVISIENEAGHYPEKSIDDYCAELAIAVDTFPNYRVTNSGFTLPLYYWYGKQQPADADFFQYCIPESSKAAFLDGRLSALIERAQYELVALLGLKIAFWNLHFYLRDANEVQPLIRMINYVSEYVGKPCISNEAGIYKAGLLPNVIEIAKAVQMKFLILYSGEGTEGLIPPEALPISKELFESVIL